MINLNDLLLVRFNGRLAKPPDRCSVALPSALRNPAGLPSPPRQTDMSLHRNVYPFLLLSTLFYFIAVLQNAHLPSVRMRRKYWFGAVPGTRDKVLNQYYSRPAKFGFGISESKKENGSLVEHGGFDSQTRLIITHTTIPSRSSEPEYSKSESGIGRAS